MSESLLGLVFSNVCVASLLGLLAYAVQRTGRWPALAHLVWVLVLVKLVTPPLVMLPVLPAAPATMTSDAKEDTTHATPPMLAADGLGTLAEPSGQPVGDALAEQRSSDSGALWRGRVTTSLLILWALGSIAVLVHSLRRVLRFHRLLGMASRPAPSDVQQLARDVAARMGVSRCPEAHSTSACISPLVWWSGTRLRIVVADTLLRTMDEEALSWVLAHELAHVKRHDHVVRWLEWLTGVLFWWNPLVWWARRHLRSNEELCCDALVLGSLRADPHRYAHSLMTVVQFLSSPTIRPPSMACAMNGGGSLERRFRMILSMKSLPRVPRVLFAATLLGAAGLLPFGMARAQDMEAVERRLGEGVAKGELTLSQAQVMMDALRREAERSSAGDRRLTTRDDAAAVERKLAEAVRSGRITKEKARERMEEMRRESTFMLERSTRTDRAPDQDGMQKKMAEALAESGISRENIRPLLGAIERIAMQMNAQRGGYLQLDERMNKYLDSLALSDEQMELVLGLSRRVASTQKDTPDNRRTDAATDRPTSANETRKRLAEVLAESGVARDKIRPLVGAVERIAYEMNAEGEEFKLDEGMAKYLDGMGLTGEQQTLVMRMAKRTAGSLGTELRDTRVRDTASDLDDVVKQIEAAVRSGSITKEEAGKKLEAIRRKRDPRASDRDIGAIKKKIEAAVRDGAVTKEEARRKLEAVRRNQDAPVSDRAIDATKRKIDAAVRDGDLTTEEARKKLEAMRRKEDPRSNARDADATKKKIEAAVRDGTLTKEEARKKLEAMRRKQGDLKEVTYTVQAGDSLAGIARRLYGDLARWEEIQAANPSLIGEDPRRLAVGMELRIPTRR